MTQDITKDNQNCSNDWFYNPFRMACNIFTTDDSENVDVDEDVQEVRMMMGFLMIQLFAHLGKALAHFLILQL